MAVSDKSRGVINNSGQHLFTNVESRFLPPSDHVPTLSFGSPDLQYVWYRPRLNAAEEFLDSTVQRVGHDQIAIIEANEDGTESRVSYGELLRTVNRCANGLRSIGLAPGDRVLLRFHETFWAAVAQLACWRWELSWFQQW